MLVNVVYQLVTNNKITFRCTNGDFYVALGSSMGLALLVWVGGGLLRPVLYCFSNEPSLGRKFPALTPKSLVFSDVANAQLAVL